MIGALVLLVSALLVPAPILRAELSFDLLTREGLVGLLGGRSEAETLSPSRLVVNPEVAPVNGWRVRPPSALSALLTRRLLRVYWSRVEFTPDVNQEVGHAGPPRDLLGKAFRKYLGRNFGPWSPG